MEEVILTEDISESSFEEVGEIFDDFVTVLVCNLREEFYDVVPYVYARNISGVMASFDIVPVSNYPKHAKYAIDGNLLRAVSLNPEILCSLIHSQEQIIPDLLKEAEQLQALGIWNRSEAEKIESRLMLFLERMAVGKVTGDGIVWLPENYAGDPDDIPDFTEDNVDNICRQEICRHIKTQCLPMARIIPFPDEIVVAFKKLTAILIVTHRKFLTLALNSHFAPMFRDSVSLNYKGLFTLCAEEFRCVKNNKCIDGDSSFIFTNQHLNDTHNTVPLTDALRKLRYYIGDFLSSLDLTRTFITGSAIAASIIKCKDNNFNIVDEDAIDLYYPKILTCLDDEDAEKLRQENINLWDIRILSETQGVMTKGEIQYPFTVKPGADIDMAIDNSVTDDEYRAIAMKHFETIKTFRPYIKIKEYIKPLGDWNYVIYTDDPEYIAIFRTIEIYRSSFRNICSHHVGAVRGCYTSRWSNKNASPEPQFYLTASAVLTSLYQSTPNYHYFAGRKSNPQDIIIKYMLRGISVNDHVLESMISTYMAFKDIHLSPLPFYEGRNIPYSLFALHLEYGHILTFRRKTREEEERRERDRAYRRQNNPRRTRPYNNNETPEGERVGMVRGIEPNAENLLTNGLPFGFPVQHVRAMNPNPVNLDAPSVHESRLNAIITSRSSNTDS